MSDSNKSYYALLGVAPDANQEEIQRAYHRLAKAIHPDQNPGSGAADEFRRLNEAYEVLSDSLKRRAYDHQLMQIPVPPSQAQTRYFSGKPLWMLPISAALLAGGILMILMMTQNGDQEAPPTVDVMGTSTPELPNLAPVTSNSAWTPFFQEFEGVMMALVPPGCFPKVEAVEWVCFENAFWMDRYEVTNAQFEALNGMSGFRSKFEGATLPRTNISWQEARSFCQARGGDLPTSDQWEYAAQGPEGWLYPWGNSFDRARVIYGGLFDESEQPSTVAIDARSNGVSWVGAQQMLGNVREWTRELEGDSPILRGGSLMDEELDALTAHQFSSVAELQDYNGFRCVRE